VKVRASVTVNELEAFLLVAETKNFRIAAERFHLSQPALSRTIQSAEAKLNARLLDRDTHRVELTAAGNELLPIARRIVDEFHHSLSDLSEFVAGRRGHIRIACLPSSAAAVLPPLMAAFQKTHPRVAMSLEPTSAEFILGMVLEGVVDFGISIAPETRADVMYEPLLRDDFVLICPRSDVLAKRRNVDWSVLSTRPMIASGPASSIRLITDRVLLETGRVIEPMYRSANISVVGALVAAGVGIAAIPRLALRLIDTSEITVVPLRRPTVYRDIGILTRTGRSLSAATLEFLELLRG
jgi:LysR family carnitine catabolism transcriptional activator